MDFILALDQGTTSSRAIVFDKNGNTKGSAQQETTLITPKPDWVEQDPMQIWHTQLATAQQAITHAELLATHIACIGITNQRETTILWQKSTGKPVYNAIIWQDRRTQAWCDTLKQQGHEPLVYQKTGLKLDPYFSATKIKWILDNVPTAQLLADKNDLAFGTVDSWLIWNLSKGERHIIDVTNASRTLMLNIHTQTWDNTLLSLFGIPHSLLPEVVASSGHLASTAPNLFAKQIPITAAIGDQQSALFGQGCTQPGMAKNTYGTGCFMLQHTGENIATSHHALLTTPAWRTHGTRHYALEGSVFMGGAIIKWLRDNLGMIEHSHEIEPLAASVPHSDGVCLVPAFTGLGAPHWQPNARALICNLNRSSTKAHIARAALEAIAFQVYDVMQAMQQDTPYPLTEMRVDGGASISNLLMQFQADLLGVPILRPKITETTALGAALLAGLGLGLYSTLHECSGLWQLERAFEPKMQTDERMQHLKRWQTSIQLALEPING